MILTELLEEHPEKFKLFTLNSTNLHLVLLYKEVSRDLKRINDSSQDGTPAGNRMQILMAHQYHEMFFLR